MRKFFLTTSVFLLVASSSFATTHTITNSGNTYTPNNLTIIEGDDILFSIASNHNAVQVSQTTYNANGNTAMPGGFSVPFGGGTVTASALPVGTYYYVCSPHASLGMKGTITVLPNTSTDIYISAFEVVPQDCKLYIRWQLEDESQVDHYLVQSSVNPDFDFNSTEPIYVQHGTEGHYQMTLDAEEGHRYYRLAVVDRDGGSYHSATREAASECSTYTDITIGPNPVTTDIATIQNTSIGDAISLYDMMGRKVFSFTAQRYTASLPTASLQNGSYLLSVIRDGHLIHLSQISVLR